MQPSATKLAGDVLLVLPRYPGSLREWRAKQKATSPHFLPLCLRVFQNVVQAVQVLLSDPSCKAASPKDSKEGAEVGHVGHVCRIALPQQLWQQLHHISVLGTLWNPALLGMVVDYVRAGMICWTDVLL